MKEYEYKCPHCQGEFTSVWRLGFCKFCSKDLKEKPVFHMVIAGSRDYNDYAFMRDTMDELLERVASVNTIVIVSGKAPGADTLGEEYAKERGYEVLPMPAQWDDLTAVPCKIKYRSNGTKYNVLAGHNRNRDMAKIANAAALFWDGVSSGTANMKSVCEELKVPLRVMIRK